MRRPPPPLYTAVGSVIVAGVLAGSAARLVAQERGRAADRTAVMAMAARIDDLLREDLTRHDLLPAPPIDDATFVRRAHLDIVGRIPTADEVTAFAEDRSPDKRAALIDRLLAAPGHDSHMFHFWADLLRVKSRLAPQVSGEPYLHWLKQALADDRPYDEMVAELLTANGPAHARDNGATGYYLRDRGMPLDNMANTARAFLGTRLECAQCHDHPFEPWTQRDFYQLAAFTGDLRYQHNGGLGVPRPGLRILDRELRRDQPEHARGLRRALRGLTSGIDGSGSGRLRLPATDADGEDGGTLLAAATPFGDAVPLALPPAGNRAPARRRGRRANRPAGFAEADTRAALADWLTSPDNPRFTRVIANRIWRRVFGRGLFEPVDDITAATEITHPALLTVLEQTTFELGYDLSQLQRVLFYTEAYQRSAYPGEGAHPYRFQGPVQRRLTAEQLWDSIVTLAVGEPDRHLAAPDEGAGEIYDRFEELAGLDVAGLRALAAEEAVRYTDPARYRRERTAARRARAATQNEERTAALRGLRALRSDLAEARRTRDRSRVAAVREEIAARTAALPPPRELRRASDLPSPAPPAHFLAQLGQSDRETIDAAIREGNVPQVLTLLNGIVERYLLRSGSALLRALPRRPNPEDRDTILTTVYRAALARPPVDEERAWWRDDFDRDPAAAMRDLVWTVTNSHEFRFWR